MRRARGGSGYRPLRPGGGQPRTDGVPVDVREEGFDVLRSLGRLVVEQKGMLPDVHHEDRLEAGRVTVLVEGNPVVAQLTGHRVLEGNRPAHAAQSTDGLEI